MQQFDMRALIRDMDRMVADSERLVAAVTGEASDEIARARHKAEQSLKAARMHLNGSSANVLQRARTLIRSTRHHIRDEPWKTPIQPP
jgi:ElaB/YqjD/DUF883 family membrane-anchored ribosome-binding protein